MLTLHLTPEDVRLIELMTADQYGYEFSSNRWEIWPRVGRGHSRLDTRHYVSNAVPALILAHRLVTASKPRGGVFGFAFLAGVLYLADGNQALAALAGATPGSHA